MRKSSYLVDPDLRPALDVFPSLDLDEDVLYERRQQLGTRFAPIAVGRSGAVHVEVLEVPRRDGERPIRVFAYRPVDVSGVTAALIHLHGGGYIMGSPALNDAQHRSLAQSTGIPIFAVEYRLAPETPYPGALQDAYAVLEWLHASADELGLDRAAIGVKGESAGAGLAAALALYARDKGGPALAFQLLTFPMLDDRTGSGAEPHPYCGEYIWSAASNRVAWTSMLGHAPGGEETPGYAAPARARDLSGLPPAFIAVGALDLFLDENLEYARGLMHAGVPVELHVYPGAVHGFGLVPGTWIEQTAERNLKEALLRFVGRTSPTA